MMNIAIDAEVDRNYDAFRRGFAGVRDDHYGEIALMRSGAIVAFFSTVREASMEGDRRFSDGLYSLQPVVDEPIDLGYFSHAGG